MNNTTRTNTYLDAVKAQDLDLVITEKLPHLPELFIRKGDVYATVQIYSGKVMCDVSNQERQEANTYFLKRIQVALMLIDIMEEHGAMPKEVITNFKKPPTY